MPRKRLTGQSSGSPSSLSALKASLIEDRYNLAMSIKDSHTVLEAMTIALVAMENSPWPDKMDETRKYLSNNYPPKSIALYLARATIRLYPARNKQDVFIQYGIAEPALVERIGGQSEPSKPRAKRPQWRRRPG
jgi:hypothetical protein